MNRGTASCFIVCDFLENEFKQSQPLLKTPASYWNAYVYKRRLLCVKTGFIFSRDVVRD